MKAPTSLFFLLLSLFPSALGALLAVDYGTEWTKASLIKPGTPLDVLLDKDSKRKMQSVVGYKRDERVFGGEAVNAATRFPLTHFPYVKPLLALTDLPASNISSIYPSQPQYDSATQTLYFPHDSAPAYALTSNDTSSSTRWSAEEILAHELNYIKALASAAAMEPVTDLYLTLPAYFTQHQRRAFKDAAEVAGLSLVGSVGEGAAVGLNYAMTRQFPKLKEGETAWNKNGAQIDVIYDSGAMKTTASVIAFYTADVAEESKTTISKSGKKSKLRSKSNPATHVHVLATASQPTLGGIQIDQALREILVKDVADKLKLSVEQVRGDDRAMRKLWKEAARTKAILSANQEASVNIESLLNDADYRSRVSRTQLEEACTGFASKFGEPIEQALAKAGLDIGDINSIILFGGNTRVPFVQAAIKAALGGGEDKIAQNVNTDEAAVLGAAYYGASQGRSVMSKLKLKVIEGLDWDVAFSVVDGDAWKIIQDESRAASQGQILFPAGTNLTTKRVLTFAKADKAKLSDTLGVEFAYSGKNAPAPSQLVRVDLRDISKAFVNMTDVEIAGSQIKVTMRLDSRGFVQAANAVVHIPITPKEKESVADKLKNLFSGSSKDEADKAEEAIKTLEAELEELEKSDTEKKVALKFSETPLGIKPLSAESKKQAKARLAAINKVEADVSARAEGRNLLEGYLYRLSGLLSPDAPSDALFRFGTDSEREKLEIGVKEAFEWMNEAGDSADVQTLLKKRADLESVEYPITRRYKEASTRPKAIDDFQKVMSAARIFFVDAQRNLTEAAGKEEPSRHTQTELDDLLAQLKENESWMKERMEAHKKIEDDLMQDPVILTADLNEKGKALQMMVIRLGNKRIPKPIKPKTKTTTATETATADDSTSTSAEPSGTSTEPSGSKPTEPEVPVHEEL